MVHRPAPGHLQPAQRRPVTPDHTVTWPPLPEADFITFLAACRRHLAARDFAAVADAYYDAAEITDLWIELRRDLPDQSMSRFTTLLTGWLRDEMRPGVARPGASHALRGSG
ncbi:MAG TPA: hypothetical protein VIJ82_23320 [Streptosporangiaceae bacterium]